MTEAEKEMVEYWDDVSEAVLSFSTMNNITPLHTILEFCVTTDYPEALTYE